MWLEAESSASGGWKMSVANDSETGRLRRRSEAMGEKESQPLRQCNQFELNLPKRSVANRKASLVTKPEPHCHPYEL